MGAVAQTQLLRDLSGLVIYVLILLALGGVSHERAGR